jgi:hypothetical protein
LPKKLWRSPPEQHPVIQNIPLARAMYKTVEIDHEISPSCIPPWPKFWPTFTGCADYPRTIEHKGTKHMTATTAPPPPVRTGKNPQSQRIIMALSLVVIVGLMVVPLPP